MNFLEERIVKDGALKEGNILKVNGFLNHLIDVDITRHMALEFQNRYRGEYITKVLTIEASGIALACMTATQLNVPMLFAKKSASLNVDGDIYSAKCYSFTHQKDNHIFVSKRYLEPGDKVLIIDDFLANGQALLALTDIVRQAGAEVVGCGIAIEKGYQGGGDLVREKGYRVESIAIIDEMDADRHIIRFKGDDNIYTINNI
ncbi:MAG: xanthine phosphoribosyltransferase [Bacteroidales bacterium]|nr:xanthine phosphoribosyltransferase [Candidatus Cryptobacteroides choladohippi]MCQ2179795.1 xanthine phosphoribosyltransferase [Bacteroidales bacterium]